MTKKIDEKDKKLLLTFDYELFLGKDSGSIEKCILEPTNRILDVLSQNLSKALFFIDANFLLRAKKDSSRIYKSISDQVLKILNSGHDIGLHIHPHWIDAQYLQGKDRWSLTDYSYYRFHALSRTQQNNIFDSTLSELQSIARLFSEQYKIDSFRAGGWCIPPSFAFVEYFKKYSIKYDSSVIPGFSKNSLPLSYYDFRDVPNDPCWRFDKDVTCPNNGGKFIEIPVTTFKINPIHFLINRFKNKQGICGDGLGALHASKREFKHAYRKLTNKMLTSDYMHPSLILPSMNKIKGDTLTYVAHPKLFSEDSFRILNHIVNNYRTISHHELTKDI